MKFSYLKCVANLSLVPILKPFWRRLLKLFETVTPPSMDGVVCLSILSRLGQFCENFENTREINP